MQIPGNYSSLQVKLDRNATSYPDQLLCWSINQLVYRIYGLCDRSPKLIFLATHLYIKYRLEGHLQP